jgi:hypothetical protein
MENSSYFALFFGGFFMGMVVSFFWKQIEPQPPEPPIA